MSKTTARSIGDVLKEAFPADGSRPEREPYEVQQWEIDGTVERIEELGHTVLEATTEHIHIRVGDQDVTVSTRECSRRSDCETDWDWEVESTVTRAVEGRERGDGTAFLQMLRKTEAFEP